MSRRSGRLGLVLLIVVATAGCLFVARAQFSTAAGASGSTQASGAAAPRSATPLADEIEGLVAPSSADVTVSLAELGGSGRITWSLKGDKSFEAASTYKLPVLMMEAERIASGEATETGLVCFESADYEDGWFNDYGADTCFTRDELAMRAGIYSDNTAAQMLVRDVGGVAALNAWAAAAGATNSQFSYPNQTTANDLTNLWVAEARGSIGGTAAQRWLYTALTNTKTEDGVPAGVPSGTLVVHKTGSLDPVYNDSALIPHGPDGAYVLTVMTSGLGATQAWPLIASISQAAWRFETQRPR